MNLWLQFVFSAAVVVFAGVRMTTYAHTIATNTRLGGVWVGSILLAMATSLPELVAAISSGLLGLPDLAVGNSFGSNIFNVAIIAILDLIEGRGSILGKVSLGHLLSGSMGIVLSSLAAIAVLADFPVSMFSIGIDSITIALVYVFGLRLISRYESRPPEAHQVVLADGVSVVGQELDVVKEVPLIRAYIGFTVGAIAIALAGTSLTMSSDALAVSTGLGATFFGTILLAAATSLPEMVSGITAVRVGAIDLAVGNLLGSNIFNIGILFLADAAYRGGSLFSAVSDTHAITALFGLSFSGIAVIGLFYRSRRNYLGLGADTMFILIGYLIAAYLLFTLR